MHWLEALEEFLNTYIRPYKGTKCITGVTIETGSPEPQTWCELVGDWLIEQRVTSCGNIALHLFPSAG